MGGFVAESFAAQDYFPSDESRMSTAGIVESERPGHRALAGLILLDAWNIDADRARTGRRRRGPHRTRRRPRRFRPRPPRRDAGEHRRRDYRRPGPDWNLAAMATHLRVPVLTIYATHGDAAENRALAEALRRAGVRVTAREIDCDHPFADHRIAMEVEVVRWLQALGRR